MSDFVPGGIRTVISRPTIRTASSKQREVRADIGEFSPPPRPHVNFLPTQPILEGLIRRALEALSRGFYWDRGSIINLLL